MKTLRVLIGSAAAFAGNGLLAGSAYLIGNNLFEWHVDKVSVEWQTTLLFSLFYAVVGVAFAAFGVGALPGSLRKITAAVTAVTLAVAWVFACILTSRLNAGYLWLVIGIPLLASYVVVRGVQHRRARAA